MVIACDVSNMASANNGGGPANDNARGSVTLLVNGEPAASGSPAAAAAAALPSLPASPPQTLALSPTSASSAVPSDAGPCTVAAAVQKLKEEEKKVQLVSKVMRRRNTKRQITRWWVRVGSYVVRNGLPSNSNERLNTEKPRFCPPFSKSMRTQVKSSKGEQVHARLCTYYVLCISSFISSPPPPILASQLKREEPRRRGNITLAPPATEAVQRRTWGIPPSSPFAPQSEMSISL